MMQPCHDMMKYLIVEQLATGNYCVIVSFVFISISSLHCIFSDGNVMTEGDQETNVFIPRLLKPHRAEYRPRKIIITSFFRRFTSLLSSRNYI